MSFSHLSPVLSLLSSHYSVKPSSNLSHTFLIFLLLLCFLFPLLSYISHPILSSLCPLILFSSLSCFIPSSLALVSLSAHSASSRACLCYLCSAGRSGAMIRLHNSHTARDGAGKCKEECVCVCACVSLCVCVLCVYNRLGKTLNNAQIHREYS